MPRIDGSKREMIAVNRPEMHLTELRLTKITEVKLVLRVL